MKNDSDIKRNGSGYYDETAYKAISHLPKAGEVWTFGDREILVLQSHSKYVNALSLLDTPKTSESIEVCSVSLKYTDPGMIQYVYIDSIGRFIKRLPKAQFEAVQASVTASLGLNKVQADQESSSTEKAIFSHLKEVFNLLSKDVEA